MSSGPTGFRPIYVVGNSRSGTTLMSKILSRNEDVYGFTELQYFERLWDVDKAEKLTQGNVVELSAKLLQTMRIEMHPEARWQDYLDEASSLTEAEKDREMSGFDAYRIVLDAETRKQGKPRACEQTPRNVFYLEEILAEFPESQVLVMVRDPRAILLSQKKKWKRKTMGRNYTPIPLIERVRRWANYHPIVTSALWDAAIKASEGVAADSRVKMVHFEDLVTTPEQTVSGICDFLGLAYNTSMLAVAASLSPTGSKPGQEGGKGIDAGVAERWKNELSTIDLYWCEHANGEKMQQLGYELSGVRPTRLMLALSLISLPFKLGLAALLNLGKMRNILRAVRRRFFRHG